MRILLCILVFAAGLGLHAMAVYTRSALPLVAFWVGAAALACGVELWMNGDR